MPDIVRGQALQETSPDDSVSSSALLPTRTPQTIEHYEHVANRLLKRYRAHPTTTAQPGSDLVDFIHWLAAQRPNWSRSTWYQYRAAVVQELRRHDEAEALTALLSVDGAPCPSKSFRWRKRKSVDTAESRRLVAWLTHVTGGDGEPVPYGQETADWFCANTLCGLRPGEWSTTEYVADHPEADGGPALVVQNGKHTNGRGNGPTRVLRLDHLEVDEIAVIRRHLLEATAAHQFGRFKQLYDGCSKLLRNANRALWPARRESYTLYSGRHQFSANAKRVHSQAGVASLLGHASDETAGRHYGRRASGKAGLPGATPDLVAGQVATVRRKARARAARAASRARRTPRVPQHPL